MRAYRFDFVFEATEHISDKDLVELGVEVTDSITSFLKAKRYKMNIVGTIDVSSGEFDDTVTSEFPDKKSKERTR